MCIGRKKSFGFTKTQKLVQKKILYNKHCWGKKQLLERMSNYCCGYLTWCRGMINAYIVFHWQKACQFKLSVSVA